MLFSVIFTDLVRNPLNSPPFHLQVSSTQPWFYCWVAVATWSSLVMFKSDVWKDFRANLRLDAHLWRPNPNYWLHNLIRLKQATINDPSMKE